ncbi:recombination protein NinG [Enterobacter roggenkampii]|uniref:recombination protein NinG n=1 Tax=Enterobacter roggenkampii TaxID=1812935 RepID=UPI0018AC0D17|nr:recombination protein NinG [Enterobacter roggenkampii]
MANGKVPKPKTCPICSTEYIPRSSLQKVCHNYKCAIAFNKKRDAEIAAREQRKREREQSADLKQRREALKTRAEWEREAQAAFNRYIRMRDMYQECISHPGRLISNSNYITGSAIDASHYRSRGAASHLRFNVFNVHAACTRCNRQLSGNAVEYRIRLIERIGLERVERLEADNEPRKFDIDYLKRVKSIFTRRARHYEKIRKRYSEAA